MDTERWQRVRALFDEAADLDPDRREAFLDEVCRYDSSEVRAEVEALLATDALQIESTGMTSVAPDLLAALDDQESNRLHDNLVGSRVGVWRLVREIGRGGMGSVFLAERDDQAYVQQAAVKIVRPGSYSDDMLQRFRAERQILAQLNHPNIARLIDGGLTEGGMPYLVLDYIDGIEIGRFCNERKLSIDDRLRLFLTVCDTVGYAHRNLIVHRDLKPTNILVDSDGRVKLLDFGIAKILDPDAEIQTSMVRLFTPEYAAPEQIRGDSITTGVDIYALGVVLYELVCGQRAYTPTRSGALSYERAILDQSPIRPSQACANGGEASARAQARQSSPAQLTARLKGDLDAIVLKAIRKESSHRYPTADAFAADVRHFLERKPVDARRGNVRYRASRFLQRHALASGLAIFAIFSLLVGLTASIWQAQLARAERDRARMALATADEVTSFLTSMLSQSTPDAQQGRNLTVREVMDRTAETIGEKLGDQPAVRGRIQMLLGQIYTILGDRERAKNLLESAETTYTGIYGADSEQVADVLDPLGELMGARGEYVAGMEMALRAMRIYESALGADAEKTLAMLDDIGVIYYGQGQYVQAADYFRRALAGLHRLPHPNPRSIANNLHNYAAALSRIERYDEAEAAHLESLAIRRRLFTAPHTNIAAGLTQLGIVNESRSRYDIAESYYRQARKQNAMLRGEKSTATALDDLDLARVALARGQVGMARSQLEYLVELIPQLPENDAQDLAVVRTLLARALRLEKRAAEARTYLEPAIKTLSSMHPEGHPLLAQALQVEADLAIDEGDLATGCSIAQNIRNMLDKSYVPGHSRLIQANALLYFCEYRVAGNPEAVDKLAQALHALDERGRSDDPLTRALRQHLDAPAKRR
jgi:serine/threonine protein kinase